MAGNLIYWAKSLVVIAFVLCLLKVYGSFVHKCSSVSLNL